MTSTDTLIANNRPLTAAHEDYLKAIYMLNKREPKVTNSLLAKHLKVTPTSATNMVKKLGELDLVEHERYQGMALTAAGERVALEVLRHHRLLELYLHEKLNLSWDQVHIEAEKLEHVISEELHQGWLCGAVARHSSFERGVGQRLSACAGYDSRQRVVRLSHRDWPEPLFSIKFGRACAF